jgi:hypothetical protein
MSPTRNKRAANRRASQNKNSGRVVVAISRSEQFAEKMARNDRATLTGKLLLTPTLSGSPSVGTVLTVTPLNLGVRAASFAVLFAEYHINFIRVKFQTPTISTSVLGFLDDSSAAEGDAPTTLSGVLEMRCSGINMVAETIPTEFIYTQKASSFWLKTYTGASGSDPRLTAAAILYAGVSSSSTFIVELDYSITFQGAVDVGSI